eukprot:gnl/MRDRNA2_/MRDRNA2_144712_c0_seq1.p1 gnl/MRDRNA2_/MRDRNA2_144712_c0~~gnl/MRDRNA2_/MRDRNA2_144712_c0_seq1.p1  ORF type:complete len:100 (-),score=5.11 gnl/MRDRNA2_/MRDRNA2_144712_c0_seq1:32-331(-)
MTPSVCITMLTRCTTWKINLEPMKSRENSQKIGSCPNRSRRVHPCDPLGSRTLALSLDTGPKAEIRRSKDTPLDCCSPTPCHCPMDCDIARGDSRHLSQ